MIVFYPIHHKKFYQSNSIIHFFNLESSKEHETQGIFVLGSLSLIGLPQKPKGSLSRPSLSDVIIALEAMRTKVAQEI